MTMATFVLSKNNILNCQLGSARAARRASDPHCVDRRQSMTNLYATEACGIAPLLSLLDT